MRLVGVFGKRRLRIELDGIPPWIAVVLMICVFAFCLIQITL